jgi:hypothetical protein
VRIGGFICLLVTGFAGAMMLADWLGRSGHRERRSGKVPSATVFAHFALAAGALVSWVAFLIGKGHGFTWAAFVFVAAASLLGLSMFFGGFGVTPAGVAVDPAGERTGATLTGERTTAIPLGIVVAHGLFAGLTLTFVLLAALGVGV